LAGFWFLIVSPVVRTKVFSVVGNGFRAMVAGVLLTSLAGCNSMGGSGLSVAPEAKTATDLAPPAMAAAQQGAPSAVVQGNCPRVVLRDGTAFYRNYAKGAKMLPDGSKEPDKLMYQVSLADTTRQCKQTDGQTTVTVMAQGRVIIGPAGAASPITMPIRVAIVDGAATTYTDLQPFQISLNPGETTGQFLYTKADVPLPAGSTDLAQIFIGFDEGPVKPAKKKKN
jgi:hypothetical protein